MFTQEAIILAGGQGTRLKEVISDIPKVMAPVNGRPFLEYILDYLEHYIIEHVVLSVGYKYEIIKKHFGNSYKSIKIDYAIEDKPLGTGGAIKYAFDFIDGNRAFVFNGDTMFRLNLVRHFDFHSIRRTDFSIVLRPVPDVSRYGSVEVDVDRKIVGFVEKGKTTGEGLINGGVYHINKRFFQKNSFPDEFSIETDCFEKFVDKGIFYGLICKQYFLDIGIPEDYQKAQDDFKRFEY